MTERDQVFISYSRHDKEWLARLFQDVDFEKELVLAVFNPVGGTPRVKITKVAATIQEVNVSYTYEPGPDKEGLTEGEAFSQSYDLVACPRRDLPGAGDEADAQRGLLRPGALADVIGRLFRQRRQDVFKTPAGQHRAGPRRCR